MNNLLLNIQLSNNKSTKSCIPRISSLDSCIFNSKLFIDLDSTYEQSLNNSYSKEIDNLDDINDIQNGRFLIKELIDELDSPKSDIMIDNSESENSKSLISLVNTGYEFIPKRYRYSLDQNTIDRMPKIFNKYNIKINENNSNNKKNFYPNKTKSIKERKGDWFCQLCSNLNFSFRKKCNRCNTLKEECMKKEVK